MAEQLAELNRVDDIGDYIISQQFSFSISFSGSSAGSTKSASHTFTIPNGYKVLDGNFLYLNPGAYSDWWVPIDFHLSGTNTANMNFKNVNSGASNTILTANYQIRFIKS